MPRLSIRQLRRLGRKRRRCDEPVAEEAAEPVVEEAAELVAEEAASRPTHEELRISLEEFVKFLGRRRNLDPTKSSRVISAAVQFFKWLGDPVLSLGKAAMFLPGWTAESVVASVFKAPRHLEDYIERGLDATFGRTNSTILNHLISLKKVIYFFYFHTH